MYKLKVAYYNVFKLKISVYHIYHIICHVQPKKIILKIFKKGFTNWKISDIINT